MRIKVWSFSMLVLALGAFTFFSAGATARPTRLGGKKPPPLKMLPKVGCEGLLTVDDFPGTVREMVGVGGAFSGVEEGKLGSDGAFLTTCQYLSAEPTEADPEPPEHFGIDVLAVEPRDEFEAGGRRHNLISVFPPLPDSSRFQIHGIGTRAFYEIDEEGGVIAYLQLRNDIFYVAKENIGGLRSILTTVAGELCKSCNEAEVPKSGKSK